MNVQFAVNISSTRQLLRYNDRACFKVIRQSALFIVSCHFFISFYATSSFGINKTREKIDRSTWFQTFMYTYSYIIPTATVRVTCIIYLSANNCISVSFLPPFFSNIENAGFCLISSSLHNFINTQMYTH